VSRVRGVLAAGALIATAALVAAAPAAQANAGQVRFVRNTSHGAFDRYISDPSAAQRSFIRDHYWRLRGYPPFFDQALRWAPPSHFYSDLYALSPERPRDRRLVARYPRILLRDAEGHPLYIPYSCSDGTCAAWAADPGNARWRTVWIRRARRHLRKGYAGVFIDNVNMLMRVGDSRGAPAVPVDQRTGEPMTITAWRAYIAGFTKAINAAMPRAEVVHNSIWFADRGDGAVARQIRAADIVELERGCSDPGIVAGTGKFGLETFLGFADFVHSQGASVLLEPYGEEPARREYDLACYFLLSSDRDAIASGYQADPGNWWAGWDTSLGAAAGRRYMWSGLLRRDFARGFVVLNEPGRPPVQFELNGLYRSPGGQTVGGSVTVGGGQGRVLIKVP
jgi:hypothetical protein